MTIANPASERSRRITSEPIGPLLVRLTLPMILGIVSMMLLGLVDTWFISLLGTLQLAAIGFVLPVYLICMSMALGLGMGISSITSRLVGENKHDKAALYISHSMFFVVLFSIAIAILLYFLTDSIFIAIGADQSVLLFIRSYMNVLLLGLPMLMITMSTGNIFRAIGAMKTSATISISLSLLNMLLDPLFIFGFGVIPAMGMAGAALATVIAACITCCASLYILAAHEKLLTFAWSHRQELEKHWRDLLKIAIPAMGANSMTPVAAGIMTAMIAQFGPEAVAGFGVGSRIESMALLVVFALSATLPMFIGQNIGAGRNDRAYHALMLGLKFSIAVQLLTYILLLVCAGYISTFFSSDEKVATVIQRYLYILPVSYGAHGVVILIMVSLNVLHKPVLSLTMAIIRLLMLYLPLAWLGSLYWQYDGLFAGAMIGNFIAAIIAYRLIQKVCVEQNIKPAATASTKAHV